MGQRKPRPREAKAATALSPAAFAHSLCIQALPKAPHFGSFPEGGGVAGGKVKGGWIGGIPDVLPQDRAPGHSPRFKVKEIEMLLPNGGSLHPALAEPNGKHREGLAI